MKRNILYPVLIFLGLFACKKPKDLPEPAVTDPDFYVNCNMDGKPLSMQAGNDDYYMNASWFRVDSSQIYVYKANLAKQKSRGYQVTILINDLRMTNAGDPMHVDSTLVPGIHLYNDENTSNLSQVIGFTPVHSQNSSGNYSWVVTDGVNSQTYNNNPYSISQAFTAGKVYTVTLNYGDGLGVCSTSHSNVFKAGSKLQTTVSASRTGSSELEYQFSYTLPHGGISCQWQFPDGSTTATPNPIKTFQEGTYAIKLKLTDNQSNDSCISYYQLNATNGAACDANYTANFQPVYNARLYGSVTVLLTDPSGNVYSSGNMIQPQSSNFQIVDVSNYNPNAQGQPTKRLTVKFNCVVKNGSSQINLTNGEARIAVAYK